MTSTASARPSAVRRAYADGPHGQVHYRRSGPEGLRSPLLLLHPCPGSGYLFDALLADCKVGELARHLG